MTIANVVAEATAWRRQFHQYPELGFTEYRTAKVVADLLLDFGLEVHQEIGVTGVVGVLRNGEGPSIALRADMDALPIQELGCPAHKSQHQQCMHACGHDGHTAMLLGAAKSLAQSKHFSGTVYFIFQPAEEGLAGAKRMIDDGLFERFKIDAIYGLHNWPGLPEGHIAVNDGAMMASLDHFEINLIGAGCHAAMPHLGSDPLVAAADLVLRLQTIVSRHLSPLESAVVSVTMFHSGEATNVIPESAQLKGTVRCLNSEVRKKVEALMHEYVASQDASPGLTANLSYHAGYPVTQNHPEHARAVYQQAEKLLGKERSHHNLPPSMASEDFSYMLEQCPGAYFWLGVDSAGETVALHNSYYDFNDNVIGVGIEFWQNFVEQQLPLG